MTHVDCRRVPGSPDFYGANMDAWIDWDCTEFVNRRSVAWGEPPAVALMPVDAERSAPAT